MSELHALSFGIVKSGCDLSDFDALLVLLLPLLLLAERARAASGDNNFTRRIYSASLVQKASILLFRCRPAVRERTRERR